jgi:OmpA-OmpF porin, OOP family
MKFQSYVLCVTVSSAVAFLPSAFAAGDISPWYAGLNVGFSNTKIDDGSLNADLLTVPGITSASTKSKDENDSGFKLFAGYQVNSNFALEGGYADLGKFTLDTAVTAFGSPATAHSEIKATGWNIDAVGIVPVGNIWSIIGRVGVIRADVKLDVTANGPGGSASDNVSSTTSDMKYGLGFQLYDVTQAFGIRGEWERYHNLGDKDTTGQGDVDLWSVGIVVKF